MITTEGKRQIIRYLMREEGTIAQSIAVGIGSAAESAANTALDFEVARATIRLVSYDFATNRLIFKATLPEEFRGTIYEVGLWSRDADELARDYGSRLVATFETFEGWTGTLVPASTNSGRVGDEVLSHTPAASTTTTSALTGVVYDFSGNSAADVFSFAYNVGNANTSNLVFRFMTDTSHYYSFSLGAQTAGYKITKLTKGAATVTGTPNWGNITQIQVLTTSGAGGASAVSLDAIRVEDTDTNNPDYTLVARELLSTPYTKSESLPYDIEFTVVVNIT